MAVENGRVKVSPVEGVLSARAGAMVGDVVIRLDGASSGLARSEVIEGMRGMVGSRAELTIRKGEVGPTAIAVIREPIRMHALLQVRADGSHLTVEAIGGRQVYEFQRSKPSPVMPLSETEFYVDGRYHTRIAFTRNTAGKVSNAVPNPERWEQKGKRIDCNCRVQWSGATTLRRTRTWRGGEASDPNEPAAERGTCNG